MAVVDLSSVSSINAAAIMPRSIYFVPLVLVVYIVYVVIKRRFFSPLSRYHGPFLASITILWKFKASLTKHEHLVYYQAHQKYGPVFRDGPNSLAFCDARAIKKIYGSGKTAYPRTDMFKPPTGKVDYVNHPPVFMARSTALHQKAKRKVAPAYTMTSVLQMENQIDEMLRQWKERLDQEADKGQIFDLCKWANYLTLDVVSELAFGAAFGFLEKDEDVMGIWRGLSAGYAFARLLLYLPALGKLIFAWPVTMVFKMPTKTGLGAAYKVIWALHSHYKFNTNHPKVDGRRNC